MIYAYARDAFDMLDKLFLSGALLSILPLIGLLINFFVTHSDPRSNDDARERASRWAGCAAGFLLLCAFGAALTPGKYTLCEMQLEDSIAKKLPPPRCNVWVSKE